MPGAHEGRAVGRVTETFGDVGHQIEHCSFCKMPYSIADERSAMMHGIGLCMRPSKRASRYEQQYKKRIRKQSRAPKRRALKRRRK